MPPSDEQSFFDRERARLAEDISKSFETLLDSTNALNRKLEEVTAPSIQKEFRTIADLWMSFQGLMNTTDPAASQSGHHASASARPDTAGLPGTGGYVPGPHDPAR